MTADYINIRPEDVPNPGTSVDAKAKQNITMKIVLSRNNISQYEMIGALMNQSLIARLSGTPHLALLTDDTARDNFAFRECFQDIRRSPGSIKVTFQQDILRDPTSGEYKFCDLIPGLYQVANYSYERRRTFPSLDHLADSLLCAQVVQLLLSQGRHHSSLGSKLSS